MPIINYSKRQFLKILLLLAVLAAIFPWSDPSLNKVMPLFDIMLAFVISLYRAEEYPNIFLFIAGCIKDILFGTPIGLHALLYISMHQAVLNIREEHSRDTFSSVWKYFIIFSATISLIYWLIMSITYYQLLPIHGIVTQWMLTVLVYPLVHELCSRLLQHIPNYPNADAE